jgi:hypothetical protein
MNGTTKNSITGTVGTVTGTPTPFQGHIDGYYDFSTSSVDYGASELSAITTSTKTVTAWINFTNTAPANPIINKGSYAQPAHTDGWLFYVGATNVAFATGGSTYFGNTALSNNTWYYLSAVFDSGGATVKVYVNGVQDHITVGGATANTTTNHLFIATDNFPNTTNGALDEVRVSNTARSVDWLVTEYNNQFTPATFHSVGVEQTIGTNLFTATWLDIDPSRADVAGYRIFALDPSAHMQEPLQVATATHSPATLQVPVVNPTSITFWLQPFLSSGLTLPISACPTAAFNSPGTSGSFTQINSTAGLIGQLTVGTLVNGITFTTPTIVMGKSSTGNYLQFVINGTTYYLQLFS